MTAADIAGRTGLSQASNMWGGMAHSRGSTSCEPSSGSVGEGGHDHNRRTIIIGAIAIAIGAGSNGGGGRSHGNSSGGGTGAAMRTQATGFGRGAGRRGNRSNRRNGQNELFHRNHPSIWSQRISGSHP